MVYGGVVSLLDCWCFVLFAFFSCWITSTTSQPYYFGRLKTAQKRKFVNRVVTLKCEPAQPSSKISPVFFLSPRRYRVDFGGNDPGFSACTIIFLLFLFVTRDLPPTVRSSSFSFPIAYRIAPPSLQSPR